MIARGEVDGKPATIAYLQWDGMFKDVEPDQAEIIKVMFDDGNHQWLTPPDHENIDYPDAC